MTASLIEGMARAAWDDMAGAPWDDLPGDPGVDCGDGTRPERSSAFCRGAGDRSPRHFRWLA